MTPRGIYVHIPFCRSRCIYCDFYSTTLPQTWQAAYVEAVGRELELTLPSPSGQVCNATSIYLGGGTPSLLSPEALRRLFALLQRHVATLPGTEVTIEANPDDVTPEWVALLKETPVSRVSMGVQSLDDGILRTLRRRHTAAQARRAVSLLQEGGYHNLSLDLIYGLPGQTLAQFEADVRQLLALGIPHLSAYALQFEPGTALFRMKETGQVSEADEELSRACYERLIDLTAEAGLEHYEISNFARPGFRSRHNSAYWTGAPYIGLGAGAHSYDGARARSFNCKNIKDYIAAINRGEHPSETEVLTDCERYDERVMLSLRTAEGLSLDRLEQDFGPERRRYCERMAAPHVARGTLTLRTLPGDGPADGGHERTAKRPAGETLCLTRRGLFVSDDIISDLML